MSRARTAARPRPDGIHATAFIHPKAHVLDAIIGARTNVWQFSSVIRGAVLGDDCSVSSCVTIDGSVYGDRCVFRPGVDIGPGVLAGNDVFFGPKITVCNDLWPRTHKRGYDMDALRAAPVVIIADGVSIGAHACILPGATLGAGCMIAAGAVVSRSVPPRHLHRLNGQVEPITDEEEKCAARVRPAKAWAR